MASVKHIKTKTFRPSMLTSEWIMLDCSKYNLGRLATQVVTYLKGKHKPYFTPNMVCGSKVILINAEKIGLSGKKRENKIYYQHTGYTGHLRERTFGYLQSKDIARPIRLAVKRMMHNTPLHRELLRNLYVYEGPNHPHQNLKGVIEHA